MNINFLDNIIMMTDSYKVTHHKQYPIGTQTIFSYLESRGGEFESIVFYGLQYFLKQYLEGSVITQDKIDEAEYYFENHFGNKKLFNKVGWEYILREHQGKLPIKIKAVPEGSIIPTHNVLMTVENTDPNCYWLTNYLETLLVQVWYPITICSLSYHYKLLFRKYFKETGCLDLSNINTKLHDFGFRGVSSSESAALGGSAHLVNFLGTDTVIALKLIRQFYHSGVVGYSIPAAEHSTITSWGKENEVNAFQNMLNKFPTGLVAIVSDSYDIYNACRNLWGEQLRDQILNRDGVTIIRPDSGYPPEVVIKVLDILGEKFGYTLTYTGHKLLNPKIRVIQGDGIDLKMTELILDTMKLKGWAADNIAFGSGGALLQKLNRDTQKFAFKCSAITIDGIECDVWKDPITDPGKVSKRGRLILDKNTLKTRRIENKLDEDDDLLQTVFLNGEIKKEYTFQQIRDRVSDAISFGED